MEGETEEAISHSSTDRSCTGAINARQIDQSPVLSAILINRVRVVKLEMFFHEPDSCFLLNSIKLQPCKHLYICHHLHTHHTIWNPPKDCQAYCVSVVVKMLC